MRPCSLIVSGGVNVRIFPIVKLQMKREALEKRNRHANESGKVLATVKPN